MHLSLTLQRPLRLLISALICLGGIAAFSDDAEAAKVVQVKGQGVKIDLKGSSTPVVEGEKYFVVVGGKKKAIILIRQVKGGAAIGKVVKGTPEVGGQLVAATAGAKRGGSVSSGGGGGGGMFSGLTIGALAGYAMDSQSVTTSANCNGTVINETIDMSGGGFSVKAMGDMPISGALGIIGRAGIEQFNVSGTSKCASLGTVKTSIMYMTADLLLRYRFLEGGFQPFGQLGLGLHFPLSKTSDTLDVNKISATSVFFFGAGMNYALSSDLYLTAMAEYGLFPPSTDVKTSMIAIRGGVGMAF